MLERSAVVLESPCLPSKIVGLWNNFNALAAKLGKQAPAHPLYFIKASTSVIGPDAPIQRPQSYPGKIIYEGELGVVIGRRCKDVEIGDAAGYVFGYTCVNDVTAAEVISENGDFAQWCRSKSYDTFGCLGPVIATEVDLSRARVLTLLDGVERQNYPLSDIIFAPLALVSHISRDMTLLPGDVIACGTSVGVGSIREGSAVEVRIDGIGALTNTLTR
jgi:2-keto-4-pentenoate hydratase/2-oxohepta-3-ene-1,7-dioic acid hydratase in catechol pathway